MNLSNADMTRYAIDLLAVQNAESVLEIGPGNGKFVPYVLEKASDIRYAGIDVSETMVEEAIHLNAALVGQGVAHFELGDGVSLPFEDDSFDKVFMVNTLYFWTDAAQQLAEIARVLRLEGFLCVAISSKAFMEQLPFTADGFTLYSSEDAKALLEANGFSVFDIIIRVHKTSSAEGQELMREEIFLLAKVE